MTGARDPRPSIDMRQLAALDAIAQERSFRGAAQALGYVQSAVSQQIVRLERHLGVRLVERGRGTSVVTLTAAGHLVLEHAAAVRDRYAAAERELAALKDGTRPRPRLRVGLVPGAPALMRDALAYAEPVAPGTAAQRLGRGELDAAFCELPLEDPRVETADVLVDPVVALVSARSPLAGLRRPARPDDFDGRPPVRLTSWGRQDEALAWLGPVTRALAYAHATDRETTLHALVGADTAWALVPQLVAARTGVRAVLLEDAPPPRRLGLAWSVARSGAPALQTFLAAVRRAAVEGRGGRSD